VKTGTLQVPGASLYYEVRGSGPVLPEAEAAGASVGANLGLFAGRLIPAIGNYQPDLAALQRSATRIVVGDHGGFGSHPDEFAVTLREVLAAG
jgi:hypothetical protein